MIMRQVVPVYLFIWLVRTSGYKFLYLKKKILNKTFLIFCFLILKLTFLFYSISGYYHDYQCDYILPAIPSFLN